MFGRHKRVGTLRRELEQVDALLSAHPLASPRIRGRALVHDPGHGDVSPGGLSHVVITVESMDATVAALANRGIDVEGPTSPDGSADFRTAMLTDPDGNRIELVQWPPGHPDGMTAADFQD